MVYTIALQHYNITTLRSQNVHNGCAICKVRHACVIDDLFQSGTIYWPLNNSMIVSKIDYATGTVHRHAKNAVQSWNMLCSRALYLLTQNCYACTCHSCSYQKLHTQNNLNFLNINIMYRLHNVSNWFILYCMAMVYSKRTLFYYSTCIEHR